jgi:drug/metabolite transporter (DMT)-like permease
MSRNKIVSWSIFILLSLIWGSAFIIMKKSAEDLNGWQIASIRIFAAGLVFLPFALFHARSVPLRKYPFIILTGLLGNLFPAYLFAIAIENKVNSSLAGILNSLTPLFVIIIGILFFRSKIEGRKIAGVLIGFMGLLILSLSKGGVSMDNFGYLLLILLATFFYGINVNIVSHYLKDVDPIKMATLSLAFMCVPAGFELWRHDVPSMIRYDEAARWSVIAIALLGVVGSAIATAFFYILIKRAGGLFASLVTYAIPVVAIFWGMLAGEIVTLVQVACLTLILGGVYLANKKD